MKIIRLTKGFVTKNLPKDMVKLIFYEVENNGIKVEFEFSISLMSAMAYPKNRPTDVQLLNKVEAIVKKYADSHDKLSTEKHLFYQFNDTTNDFELIE